MSSLPILYRLLFLFALHAPQAQGTPVTTPGTQRYYGNLIQEIVNELDKLPVASEVFLNSNEKRRLMKTSLRKPNLEEFLTFATDSLGEDSKITKNLKEIQPILPTTMSTEEPILIEQDNLGDFQVKLKEYLSAIRDSLNSKNT
ncbi:interleukin-3 [Physeter macrocephalus]|uniref:Interleukin-3 n=1 Tax=Physeter macrocephalus TaxID=9755 RepID=A0A2Y9FD22_PHYMC|nr:interleukin-3 [Physeter catodon]|eukprot:XP_007120195.1 interleukin-3 [Physeter catodon]